MGGPRGGHACTAHGWRQRGRAGCSSSCLQMCGSAAQRRRRGGPCATHHLHSVHPRSAPHPAAPPICSPSASRGSRSCTMSWQVPSASGPPLRRSRSTRRQLAGRHSPPGRARAARASSSSQPSSVCGQGEGAVHTAVRQQRCGHSLGTLGSGTAGAWRPRCPWHRRICQRPAALPSHANLQVLSSGAIRIVGHPAVADCLGLLLGRLTPSQQVRQRHSVLRRALAQRQRGLGGRCFARSSGGMLAGGPRRAALQAAGLSWVDGPAAAGSGRSPVQNPVCHLWAEAVGTLQRAHTLCKRDCPLHAAGRSLACGPAQAA